VASGCGGWKMESESVFLNNEEAQESILWALKKFKNSGSAVFVWEDAAKTMTRMCFFFK
jgi:hypothetical protein